MIGGFLLLIYFAFEGITGNILNTEPGAIAGFIYWIADKMHRTVSVNLVMLFYTIGILIAFMMMIGGYLSAGSE